MDSATPQHDDLFARQLGSITLATKGPFYGDLTYCIVEKPREYLNREAAVGWSKI